jgi:hypothetical protein
VEDEARPDAVTAPLEAVYGTAAELERGSQPPTRNAIVAAQLRSMALW